MGWLAAVALLSGPYAALGAFRRDEPWRDPVGLGVVLLTALAVATAAGLLHRPGVPAERLAWGIGFGALSLGLLPPLAYWALGRALGHRPTLLSIAWLVSLFGFYYYFAFTYVITVAIVRCAPWAKECPY